MAAASPVKLKTFKVKLLLSQEQLHSWQSMMWDHLSEEGGLVLNGKRRTLPFRRQKVSDPLDYTRLHANPLSL
jgi:hypothetical protein